MPSHDVEALLRFDAVTAAMRALGRSRDDKAVRRLAGALEQQHSVKRAALLAEMDDTRWAQPLREVLRVAVSEGFSGVSRRQFAAGDSEDEQHVLFRSDGLLLICDSYRTFTNSAVMYFNWQPAVNADQWRPWLDDGHLSWAGAHGPVWGGALDVREGLRWRLRWLAAHGQFLSAWPVTVDVSPFHHADTDQSDDAARMLMAQWPQSARDLVSLTGRSAG